VVSGHPVTNQALRGFLCVDLMVDTTPTFHDSFVELFDTHFERLWRYMSRLSGEPDLASDLVQEAFVSLYRRGSMPDSPEAWLISVVMNRYRNVRTGRTRRLRLLTPSRSERLQADAPSAPDEALEAEDLRQRVRRALDTLPERDRHMLLLHAEGYRYREIAAVLRLNEGSVGTYLARARRAFREAYEDVYGTP